MKKNPETQLRKADVGLPQFRTFKHIGAAAQNKRAGFTSLVN